jgi:hypothetical protein
MSEQESASDFIVDYENHKYTVNGQIYPSVTDILSRMYDFSGVPKHYLEEARLRGKAVHKIIELDCFGILDDKNLDPQLLPYLTGWRKFVDDVGFEVAEDIHGRKILEYSLFDKFSRFAGTLDLVGYFRKRANPISSIPRLIDIKTPTIISPVCGLQLAAYQSLLATNNVLRVDHRDILQLTNDGKYHLRTFTDISDKHVFMGEVNSYWWRKKYLTECQEDSNFVMY